MSTSKSDNRNARALLALLACLVLGACSSGIPGLYRVPIQQGNVITVQMLQELKLGMDKRKVKFILGTPLVIDVFHLDRWDYYYSYKPGLGDTVQQRASLFFEDNRLVRVDADIDSGIDFHTVTHATDKVVIVPPKKDSGFLAAITPAFLKRDEEEHQQEAIERSLDSGFNEEQPGSGATAAAGEEVLDPALAAPAVIGPTLEAAAAPSEIYAPNTSTDSVTAGGPQPVRVAPEKVSAETASQSRYLEKLFDGFGTAPVPESAAAKPAEAKDTEPESVVFTRRDPTQTTRD